MCFRRLAILIYPTWYTMLEVKFLLEKDHRNSSAVQKRLRPWLFRLGTNHFGSLWITWKSHLCLQNPWDVQPLHHRVWWSSNVTPSMMAENSTGFFGRFESRCSVCLYHADRPEGQVRLWGANWWGWLVGWLWHCVFCLKIREVHVYIYIYIY